MNIPILVDKMAPGVKKILHIFQEVIALLFSAIILVYGGVQITTLAMGQMTSSLGVPIGVFYVVLLIAGVLKVIYTIINIVEIANRTLSLDTVDEAEAEVAAAAAKIEEV